MTAVMDAPVLTPAAPKLKPGKVWYWIFGLLTLLSLLAAGAIWLTGRITVENDVKAFARFVAPNEAQLRFKRGGEYLIYYEYAGKVDDTEIEASSTPPGGLELTMRDAQGESIDLRPTPKPLSYDVGGYSGVALRLARIDQPGDFTLSAGPPSLSPFAVAIGRGEPPSADSWNQAAILVGAIGAGLGVIGLIVTALLRRRSRAARTQQQTAAALAAPLDPVAPVAPAAATAAWAAPGDATADPGAVPPPPSVVPPAPVASVVPAGFGVPPPPPPAGDVPPPLAGESVGPTPPLPPPPPGATPPSAFEPAPPPGALAAPPPSVSDAVPPSVSDAVPPSVSDAVPPEPPPLPEPPATSEPEAPETSEWAPPAAGSATEPGTQPSSSPPPPPPP